MNIKKKEYVNSNGFTLLETVVAVSVILAIMVGSIALIGHVLWSQSFSRNDLTAYGLAQEGIELVRAIRDNNILCATPGVRWNDNPQVLAGQTLLGDYYRVDALSSRSLRCGANTINTPWIFRGGFADCTASHLSQNSAGTFTYFRGFDTLTRTIFSRCVEICSPPDDAPCNAPSDSDIPATPNPPNPSISNQMEVISTVSWQERGTQKHVTLRTRLYNWQ